MERCPEHMSSKGVTRLTWDSNFFDMECGFSELATEDCLTDELLKSFTAYDFVKLVNENNLNSVNRWIGEKTRAYLTDINVIFSYDLEGQFVEKLSNHFSTDCYLLDITNLQEKEAVKKMAKSSFIHTRFFNDSNFPKDKVEKMYENWVENAILDSSKEIFVLKKEQGVVGGFIVLAKDELSEQLIIELIAVKSESRGRGYGSELLAFSKEFAKKNSLKKIIVGTQVDNLQGMNVYIKNGFFVNTKRSIYHLWNA